MNPDPITSEECAQRMHDLALKVVALEARVNVLAGTNIAVIGALVAFAVV